MALTTQRWIYKSIGKNKGSLDHFFNLGNQDKPGEGEKNAEKPVGPLEDIYKKERLKD
jgi:hypothetical protein